MVAIGRQVSPSATNGGGWRTDLYLYLTGGNADYRPMLKSILRTMGETPAGQDEDEDQRKRRCCAVWSCIFIQELCQ